METAIVGIFTIGGVILGSLLTSRFDRRGQQRATALDVRMRLADLYDLIWGEQSHARLVIETEKLRAQLEWLGVDTVDIEHVITTAFACWTHGNESLEHGDIEAPSLDNTLLTAFREASAAIVANLPS